MSAASRFAQRRKQQAPFTGVSKDKIGARAPELAFAHRECVTASLDSRYHESTSTCGCSGCSTTQPPTARVQNRGRACLPECGSNSSHFPDHIAMPLINPIVVENDSDDRRRERRERQAAEPVRPQTDHEPPDWLRPVKPYPMPKPRRTRKAR